MKRLLLLFLLLLATPAFAQIIPDGNVLGRPVGGGAGLAVNVPIATLSTSLACANILAYGGDLTGASDNTTAFNAAVTAGGTHACVYFPAGLYKFTSVPTVTLPTASQGTITIRGDGIDSTEIRPTGSGFTFSLNGTYQSFHIQNLSITTASACTACTAISVTQNATNANPADSGQSDITNVAIYGVDRSSAFPSGSDYFGNGIVNSGVSNVNYVNLRVDGVQSSGGPAAGSAVQISGTSTINAVVENFVNTTLNLYTKGLNIGSYTQGITLVNANMTGNQAGVYVSAATSTGVAQLAVSNSQFNNCTNIYVPPPAGATITITGVFLTNNYFIADGQAYSCGAFLTNLELNYGSSYVIVDGNTLSGISTVTGIHASGISYTAGKISHNLLNGFGVAIDTTPLPGVNTTGLLIDGNTITNNTTGIQLGAFTVDAVVSNNILEGNTTDLVNNTGNLFKNFVDIPQDCHALGGVGFSIGGSSTGITYSQALCTYAVVNREAFLDIDYTFSSLGGLSGALTFLTPGLSVNAGAGGDCYIGFAGGMTGLTSSLTGNLNANGGTIFWWQWGAGGTPALTAASMTNSARILARCTWRTVTVQ